MPHSILVQDFVNHLIVEMVPLSVISARGVPNHVNMWLRRNWATTLASLVRVGIASTHLET